MARPLRVEGPDQSSEADRTGLDNLRASVGSTDASRKSLRGSISPRRLLPSTRERLRKCRMGRPDTGATDLTQPQGTVPSLDRATGWRPDRRDPPRPAGADGAIADDGPPGGRVPVDRARPSQGNR